MPLSWNFNSLRYKAIFRSFIYAAKTLFTVYLIQLNILYDWEYLIQWVWRKYCLHKLTSCLIYARALLEYVGLIVIMWLRSVNKMLPSVKFAEYKVFTFLILREKC